MAKISDESYALLKRLKKEYVKHPADITPARGNSKSMLAFALFSETNMAKDYIMRIMRGENLTETDWERDLKHLYEMVGSVFQGD